MRTLLSTVLALALGLPALALPANAGELSIHMLRVGNDGQGMSVYVEGPDGTRVLIDAGNNGDGNSIVRPYLLSLGVTDLDYTIVSHYHADHMGGMDGVMNGGHKPNIAAYDRGDLNISSTSTVLDYLAAVSGVRQTATVGTLIPLGDGAVIEIVAVNGAALGGGVTLMGGGTQYENASSVASIIRYRDFEMYVGGDLTAGGNGTPDIESGLAQAIGQIDVVAASHHGSFTSSSSVMVANFAPSLVLHSAGFDNPFGHPDDRIVERFSTTAATRVQWCTTAGDTSGVNEAQGFTEIGEEIVITTDGERFIAKGADDGEELWFTTHENPGPIPSIAGVNGPTSLAVTELMINPSLASETFGEWFELTNVSSQPFDLFGTRFLSGSSSFTLASRILLRQGESIVVGDDGKRGRNGDVFVHVGPSGGTFSMANSSGALSVINQNAQTVETIVWGGADIPTAAGATSARLAADDPAVPANFVLSTLPWGAGTDDGSPGVRNSGDTTDWTAGLWAPNPYVGGRSDFFLSSIQDPLKLHFLGLSQSVTFPFQVFGQNWFLVPDAFFNGQLTTNPLLLGQLDGGGERTISIQLPNDPGLAGFQVFSQFIVLEFAPSLTGVRSSNFDTLVIGF